MKELMLINEAFGRHLHAINQLTLTEWSRLSSQLEVGSDREWAAKKLALRELRAAGKIA
jgi:hypothetical protein